MATNRYDDITVSGYTPQTMQELAFTPMMQRQKHDKLLADQEAIISGLAKVDPLDVHYNKALELKKGIESKIDRTANDLAQHGINNDMIGQTIAMNRQYQDLVSPTGEIGKINEAKQYYNKQKEEFIKNAEAQKIGRDIALQRWNEKTSDYTGFDLNKKISNVTPQGVAAFQDYGQQLSRAHSILGETIKGMPTGGGYHLESTPDGGTIFVNRQGERVKGDNAKQVESAYNSFRDSWINGEGAKYSKDAGLGIDEERIRNDFNSMLKDSDISKENVSANYNAPNLSGAGNGEGFDNAEGIPSGEVEGTQKNVDDFKEKANNIGKTVQAGYQSDASGAPVPTSSRTVAADEIFKKGTYERKLYDSASKLAKAKGISLDKAIDLKSKEFEPMIIKPDIINNKNLFPTMLITKDIALRDANIKKDLMVGTRSMYDVKTGEKIEIAADDWKDKEVKYYGMLSPVNLRTNKMKTKDQQISPHYVLVDGNTYLMGRTSTELNSNSFATVRRINDVWNSMVDNSDEVVKVPSDWGNLGGLKMRYNSTNTDSPIEILNGKNEVIKRLNSNQWIGIVSKHIK